MFCFLDLILFLAPLLLTWGFSPSRTRMVKLYESLPLPKYTPPKWIYAPAWFFFDLVLGWTAVKIYHLDAELPLRQMLLAWFAVHLFLEIVWSAVFVRKLFLWTSLLSLGLWATGASIVCMLSATTSCPLTTFLLALYFVWLTLALLTTLAFTFRV